MNMPTDSIRSAFRLKLYEMMQQSYHESIDYIQDQREGLVVKAGLSLEACLAKLVDQYDQLFREEKTGVLCCIYISFLRSGILSRDPWCRMDAYDHRGENSPCECGQSWDFSEISSRFYTALDAAMRELKTQSKMREYDLDSMAYEVAELYQKGMKDLMPDVLKSTVAAKGEALFGDHPVDFMVGEFLDKTTCILKWRSDDGGRKAVG